MSDEKLFHQWLSDGNLSIDVEVLEADGTKSLKRVTIERDRLVDILVEDHSGMRFFLNRVVGKLRPAFGNIMKADKLQKMVQAPKMAQEMFAKPRTRSDDLLSPQILELEKQMIPAPEVPGYHFDVTV